MVVPALSTLLGFFPRDLGSYLFPALWTLLFDKIGEFGIFLDCPRAFNVSYEV